MRRGAGVEVEAMARGECYVCGVDCEVGSAGVCVGCLVDIYGDIDDARCETCECGCEDAA